MKVRKWRSIFNLGRSGHETKRKLPLRAEDRGKSRMMRAQDFAEDAQGPGVMHIRMYFFQKKNPIRGP